MKVLLAVLCLMHKSWQMRANAWKWVEFCIFNAGGGSALLPYPVEPLTLEDVLNTTRELFAHGASILEVNTVRKHLEVLKGGGLAREAMPAQVVTTNSFNFPFI